MSPRRFTPVLCAALLMGCPTLTQPSEGDPGYGPSNAGPSPSTNTNTANTPGPPSSVKPPPRPPMPIKLPTDEGASEKIRASHILVGWKGAAGPPQQRTKEEAKKRIDAIIARLKNGEEFGKLAQDFGEDGTKMKGGDLGEFDRGTMVKPFSDAAFALKPGEVSGVVETQFGYHVIKRTK